MEFAAASLDRDGGSRVGAGAAPHQAAAAPLLHWGSAGRKALDASGKRSVKVFACVIALHMRRPCRTPCSAHRPRRTQGVPHKNVYNGAHAPPHPRGARSAPC